MRGGPRRMATERGDRDLPLPTRRGQRALKWPNVDLGHGVVTVAETLTGEPGRRGRTGRGRRAAPPGWFTSAPSSSRFSSRCTKRATAWGVSVVVSFKLSGDRRYHFIVIGPAHREAAAVPQGDEAARHALRMVGKASAVQLGDSGGDERRAMGCRRAARRGARGAAHGTRGQRGAAGVTAPHAALGRCSALSPTLRRLDLRA